MDDFPPNSQKARTRETAEPKKIERVTTAETVRRKRGFGQQFKETFIGGSAKLALHYMLLEVVIPAVQDTLIEAFQGGVEKLIKGESRSRRRGLSSSYGSQPYIPYNRMGPPQASQTSRPRSLPRSTRARHDFDDIVIATRQEAEEVIERLYDLLDRYGSASVFDLYELTGIQNSHQDQKWGWTNLRGTNTTKLRSGGYLLNLPDPEPLD